ncbi:Cell division control protein 3 [Wickerhamiella sorbophila]|uniref:Cell division control protein 3 n=1 Tax=Wickerhamiella sorbophila TaxID=45607 RepID=A0A2T0FBU5_9ASCO|nr:Cell division control protein 3 [Wickerhamiella sorbophila]PRT52484.1 Cell division control protein 3 [Wickerhamiella sorbophila]
MATGLAELNGVANGFHPHQVPSLDGELDREDVVADAQSLSVAVAQAGNHNGPDGGALSVTTEASVIRRKLNGFVGFSNLPQQWHQKSLQRGFNLNVMVVGESGLGKTTLLTTLFETRLQGGDSQSAVRADGDLKSTVDIKPFTADLEENGVKLRLTVIDTPGFGDYVNNSNSWKPIIDEIDGRYDQYLEAENSVNRSRIPDNRVHACLYFIEPTGHSLKPLDINVMRKLHQKVNLIPVIAKSDTLTEAELEQFKNTIRTDIAYQGIQIFQPPRYSDDDEETQAETAELVAKFPFAVIGSTELVATPDGRNVRGRQYPWGVVEVDNEEHCDFVKLRSLLVRSHLEDLREHTANALYENYRTQKMLSMGIQQDSTVFREVNPALRQEEERAMHEQRLAKMEAEMRAVFQQKVTEKEQKLKKSEADLFARHKEIKEQLERQRAELEARKAKLEAQAPPVPATVPSSDDKKGRKFKF